MIATINNIWEFMSDSPLLTFFLACVIFYIVEVIFVSCSNAIIGWRSSEKRNKEEDEKET